MRKEDYKKALQNSWGFVKSECVKLEIDAVTMARETGIPRSTIRSYFNSNRDAPRPERLNKMVKFILVRKGEIDG